MSFSQLVEKISNLKPPMPCLERLDNASIQRLQMDGAWCWEASSADKRCGALCQENC